MKDRIISVALALILLALPSAVAEGRGNRSSSFAMVYPANGTKPENVDRLSCFWNMDERELSEMLYYQFVPTPLWGIYRGSISAYAEDGSIFDFDFDWSDTGEECASEQAERLDAMGRDEYFGDVSGRISELAPKGTVIGAFGVWVDNYEPGMGAGWITIDLPPGCKPVENAPVAMAVGLKGEDGFEWRAFEASSKESYTVEGQMDSATLLVIQKGTALLFILQ